MRFGRFGMALLVLLAISCSVEEQPAQTSIKIGAVFHLTGDGSSWGDGERKAAILAVEEINAEGGIKGLPVELIIEDGMTDNQQTLNMVQKLILVDNVPVIIGPTWAEQIIASTADTARVVIISPSTITVLSADQFFFNLWPGKEPPKPSDEFREKFKNNFGIEPSPSAMYSYDAVKMIADAMEHGAADSESIAAYLNSIKVYNGVSGQTTLNNHN